MAKQDSLPTKKLLTPAHEDYLKAIYILKTKGGEVNNSALASYLDVSPASATNMVKKLAELELVTYTPYQSMTLTPLGERMALEVLRHHRLVELYLHQKLNLPWDQVHMEAERLEHVISETLEDAIAAALNDPTVDPHGDPIPSKDGRIEKIEGAPLSIAELNRPYRIVRVLLQDPERLSYLGALGLYPNAAVTLLKRSPFSGPLLIDIAGEHHALAHDMAEQLLVVPIVEEANRKVTTHE
jgi:DtxR family Mn-dependent transcriptional regulator